MTGPVLVGGALLAWLLFSGSDSEPAAAASTAPRRRSPRDVGRRVADALATESVEAMRGVAAALRREGFTVAADELEGAATDLEEDRQATAEIERAAEEIVITTPGIAGDDDDSPEPPGMSQDDEGDAAGVVFDDLLRGLQRRVSRQLPTRAPADDDDDTPPEMRPEPEAEPERAPPVMTMAERLATIGDPVPGAPLLRRGDKGAAVSAWQRTLLELDRRALPRFGADGDFGRETAKATRDMQVRANALYLSAGLDPIAVDGVVGPDTRTAAARLLEVG